MRIPHAAVPKLRLITIASFVTICALMFGYLWLHMGGRLPIVSQDGYRVTFHTKDVDNLVYDSDVMVAGVDVGKIEKLSAQDGTATGVLQINDSAALPLHQGVHLRLRSKSLIEETYVEIQDGHGAEIPNGATLPGDAVIPSVQLDDVLDSLDSTTRADLGSVLRSLGASTHQSSAQLSQTLSGLGDLGRHGYTVLEALKAQSTDLRRLVVASSGVMQALDSGQGQIVSLVEQADRLTSTTARQNRSVEATMRALPGVLTTAKTSTASLSTLASDLSPITTSLRQAAPALSGALTQLPATTRDLRATLPSLDGTLVRAPRTLRLVPATSTALSQVIPSARSVLADLNPMLAFVQPYSHDLAAFLANWNAMLTASDVNGHYLRIFPVLNEQSLKGLPIPLNEGILDKSNAYPSPGGSRTPGPFTGTYPHVGPDPK
ncbi:MAG TPA: MlaD family protein [Nocardioides sp.]|nr:MlaD family protein [Nocardioides sp.]